ncbi:Succinate-semialdehyde dehydrogenase [Neofusicoccum parvum]|uniref:Succinate-semialdehyde dehydrogenase n=1 Tax=Neofusicoccum parvum TaxID=310453 RepID=A0ACB5SBV2_9PEZI|nr:Succinate-semialdehyde dehydrogenase [Neofusicoccum parvum]
MRKHPRTRSLDGCATCRSRRVKCDETRPVCSNCQRLGLTCQGYETRLVFLQVGQAYGADDLDNTKFRRPLFTEEERLGMSEELRTSMRRAPAERALARLDDQSQDLEFASQAGAHLSHGPFAVFKVGAAPSTPEPPGSPLPLETGAAVPDLDASVDMLDVGDQHFEAAFAAIDHLLDVEDEPADQAQQCLVQSTATTDLAQYFLTPSLPLSPEPMANRDAGLLLMHYKDHVIRLLSPLKYHRKTPWNVLQLPCAMNTLAELTMGYKANNARTSVFYGLLAISAFNLGTSSSGTSRTYWKNIAATYKAQAHEALKMSLGHELSQRKKAKYKEVLMAILCMVTISAFSGAVENTRPYLLDAERLIRLHGLTKSQKSRKVRLLHHCYAYLRIMYETTSLSMAPGSSFRVFDWDSDLEMQQEKDSELAVNDLHLEIPGHWRGSLYPDVYGIPESLMLLISQATRLGNEREVMQTMPGDASFTAGTFFQRAKAVERLICKWKPPPHNYPEGYDPTIDPHLVDSNRRVVDHILLAMHQALIIYFYRRVYDLNPLVLQPNVEETILHLQQIQAEDTATGSYTVGIVWPGFIAGCEATSPDLQQRFLAWFEASEKNSTLPTFKAAAAVAQTVWKRREEQGDEVSWPTVLREQQMTVLCT